MRIRALRRWRKLEENRGNWRHMLYKVRSELKKLMGSDAGRLAGCVTTDAPSSINIRPAPETSSTLSLISLSLSLSLWYFQLRRHRHRQLSQVVRADIDSDDPMRGVDAGDTNPIDFVSTTPSRRTKYCGI
ncbi:hypothetical protein ACFX2J_000608 [Malus domestica]